MHNGSITFLYLAFSHVFRIHHKNGFSRRGFGFQVKPDSSQFHKGSGWNVLRHYPDPDYIKRPHTL